MTFLAPAACLLVGFGLGWLTKRHRLSLLAENNHWVGEEIQAIKGADLDADVAAERAWRISGEQPAVDPEPPEWINQSGYRAPSADRELSEIFVYSQQQLHPCEWSDDGINECEEPSVGTAELTPGETWHFCEPHYQWACHGAIDDPALPGGRGE